jgi:hypothetical protein
MAEEKKKSDQGFAEMEERSGVGQTGQSSSGKQGTSSEETDYSQKGRNQ